MGRGCAATWHSPLTGCDPLLGIATDQRCVCRVSVVVVSYLAFAPPFVLHLQISAQPQTPKRDTEAAWGATFRVSGCVLVCTPSRVQLEVTPK